MSHLILVRHGQSEWNSQNRFTGWVDIDLTANGKLEACKAGELIKDLNIEITHFYSSYQKRAINTLKLILNTIRVKNEKILKAWELNERHYGELTGLNKDEMKKKYGEKKAFEKAIDNAKKVAMSLSDLFCVKRHKQNFLELVEKKLDLTFANESEIMELINVKNFNEVIDFAKEINKHIVITRGEKGAISIFGNEIIEIEANKNLTIKDLTGAGDLFAAGYLHGFINNLSVGNCLELGTKLSSKVIQQIGARL